MTLADLLATVLLVAVVATGAAYAIRQIVRPGWLRLYWVACLALIALGIAGIATARPYDSVPPEFALGFWALVFGVLGALLPAGWRMLQRGSRRG